MSVFLTKSSTTGELFPESQAWECAVNSKNLEHPLEGVANRVNSHCIKPPNSPLHCLQKWLWVQVLQGKLGEMEVLHKQRAEKWMPQLYLSRLIPNSPLGCTAVFQCLPFSCGKDVNSSQTNTAQGQSPRWPTKSERGESNWSVLQIFPSKHCKISISLHEIHVLVYVCFPNMFQVAAVTMWCMVVEANALVLGLKTESISAKCAFHFPHGNATPYPHLWATFSCARRTNLCSFGTISHHCGQTEHTQLSSLFWQEVMLCSNKAVV